MPCAFTIPATFSLSCDITIFFYYSFNSNLYQEDNQEQWKAYNLELANLPLLVLAIIRFIVFLLYIWKMTSPWFRIRYCYFFTWLMINILIISYRLYAIIALRSDTVQADYNMVILSYASVVLQIYCMYIMTYMPPAEVSVLEYH